MNRKVNLQQAVSFYATQVKQEIVPCTGDAGKGCCCCCLPNQTIGVGDI